MARNETLKMADALREAFEAPELAKGTGSMRFNRADRRGSATIYLTRGMVVAIVATDTPNYIFERVVDQGLLSAEDEARVRSRFAQQPHSPAIAHFMAELMMVSENSLNTIIKRHFLAVFDEIMAWSVNKSEWRQEDAVLELTMPLVSKETLLELGLNRQDYLRQLADSYGVAPGQLNDLTFRVTREINTDDSTVASILSVGSGEYTAQDVYARFGITPFRVHEVLNHLWQDGAVELMFRDFPILRTERDEVVDTPAGLDPATDENPVVPAASVDEAVQTPELPAMSLPPREVEVPVPVAAPVPNPNRRGVSQFVENAVDDAIEEGAAARIGTVTAAPEAPTAATELSFAHLDDEEILDVAPITAADTIEPEPLPAVSPTVAAAVAVAGDTVLDETDQVDDVATGSLLDTIRVNVQSLRERMESAEADVDASDAEEKRVLAIIEQHQTYLDEVREDRSARVTHRDALRRSYTELITYLRKL